MRLASAHANVHAVMWRHHLSLERIRGLVRYLLAGSAAGEDELIAVLTFMTSAIAPPGFEVERSGSAIHVRGTGMHAGRMKVLMPLFLWRAEVCVEERLRYVLDAQGSGLQEFFTASLGVPWPSDGFERHVEVDHEAAVAWWGPGDDPSEAIVTLGPIRRSDLGV